MKTLISVFLFTMALNANSSVCKTFQEGDFDYANHTAGDVLTKEVWKSIDVVASFPFKECHDAISQSLIKVDGQNYWVFRSTEDHCDGGNTYGSIYSEDLKTPIAHIYDSDIYCEEDWREDERAVHHRCDIEAEKLAQDKMKEFGFDFEVNSSSLELRSGYSYSFIFVEGKIKNKGDKLSTIKVLANLKSCQFATVSISDLTL
ncbi:MAG: hypothetical protein COW01_05085 [Bdellovibrionales bacterium CG12_big_fil_rev_8_21_14_0_65_38_15]|nr:MAG: hypothetical protein COW79_14365 [Bdellovibrionales bacterium CG22_combo_CG10-13_8_21_14_all_38_13]PIQ56258.1 MAG: hypothetical protein COW01_05085 [Bdellovibrionales bacterium CG12_big_fil_rev_8_21_14_0_65_38_15]PIR30402.1 MAG: hypothetical protein COV38_06530 [Bdellovibrionales bacterium CG11_big_fil_rev_8_21_14_0_20_38_13]